MKTYLVSVYSSSSPVEVKAEDAFESDGKLVMVIKEEGKPAACVAMFAQWNHFVVKEDT